MAYINRETAEKSLAMGKKERYVWRRVPIIEPLTPATMWEHTPLDYYRYGEYPRFLRPPGDHQPRWEWKKVPVQENDDA